MANEDFDFFKENFLLAVDLMTRRNSTKTPNYQPPARFNCNAWHDSYVRIGIQQNDNCREHNVVRCYMIFISWESDWHGILQT